jgi:hypothetical protein
MHIKFLSENLNEGYHFGYIGIDGKAMFKWMLRKQDVTEWTGFI